ncbi:MAG: xylulokinase, partial [Planctomycetota bacterium]
INTQEGGALGVALLAGVGTGVYSSVPEACGAAIKITETLRPERSAVKVYDGLYPTYQSLYQSLRGDFAALGRMI